MTGGAFLERQQIELAKGRTFNLGRIIPQPIYMLTVQKETFREGTRYLDLAEVTGRQGN
jgi:hypothetical protein